MQGIATHITLATSASGFLPEIGKQCVDAAFRVVKQEAFHGIYALLHTHTAELIHLFGKHKVLFRLPRTGEHHIGGAAPGHIMNNMQPPQFEQVFIDGALRQL